MGKGSKPKKVKAKQKAAPQQEQVAVLAQPDGDNRPTQQRQAKGRWAKPQGAMKSAQPFVDLASDAIGQMHQLNLLSKGEEQAARQFQAARAAYLQELPDISGYRSCISGSVPGYDDSDGDPLVIKEYRRLEKLIGLRDRSLVLASCEEGHVPNTWDGLVRLKVALGRIAGSGNAAGVRTKPRVFAGNE